MTKEEFAGGDSTPDASAKTERLFAARDKNRDGSLTLDEFVAVSRAVDFVEKDADGDNHLALAEYLGARTDPAALRLETDVFEICDGDGDRKLTLAEFTSNLRQVTFRRIDLDGDGGLDLQEFHQGDMRWASIGHAQRVFQLTDRDDDGTVSFDEFRTRPPEASFARTDSSGDGRLSMEEYRKAHLRLRGSSP